MEDLRIETERLIIRNWNESDVAPYLEIVSDPDVMKYIGDGLPRGIEYARSFVADMMEKHNTRGWYRFAVEHKGTGQLMGFCGFEQVGDVQDFGWRYHQNYWGGGFGTEAGIAVLKLGRDRYNLPNIQAKSYPENIGSVRIMEKMGLSYLFDSTENGRRVVNYGFPDDTAAV